MPIADPDVCGVHPIIKDPVEKHSSMAGLVFYPTYVRNFAPALYRCTRLASARGLDSAYSLLRLAKT